MMFPLVRDLAADGISVAVTCRVLGFSRQAFYKWNTDPVSRRDWDDAHLINAALDIHAGDPEFGYRFIADELPAHGIVAGENRVHRLCSQQRIFSVFAKKRGLHRRSGPPVHDDLVRRQFSAQRPDRLWLTDITEHWTDEGKLYLCAIKDCFSTEDRRLFDLRPDDRGPGVFGAAKRYRAPQPGRHRGSFRSRQPISFRNVRRVVGLQWFTRFYGEGGGIPVNRLIHRIVTHESTRRPRKYLTPIDGGVTPVS